MHPKLEVYIKIVLDLSHLGALSLRWFKRLPAHFVFFCAYHMSASRKSTTRHSERRHVSVVIHGKNCSCVPVDSFEIILDLLRLVRSVPSDFTQDISCFLCFRAPSVKNVRTMSHRAHAHECCYSRELVLVCPYLLPISFPIPDGWCARSQMISLRWGISCFPVLIRRIQVLNIQTMAYRAQAHECCCIP